MEADIQEIFDKTRDWFANLRATGIALRLSINSSQTNDSCDYNDTQQTHSS